MTDISGNIKCKNGEIIKELLLAGMGITIKSTVDIQDEISRGVVMQLLQEYEVLNNTQFYATYAKGRDSSPKIKAFVNFLRNKISEIEN